MRAWPQAGLQPAMQNVHQCRSEAALSHARCRQCPHLRIVVARHVVDQRSVQAQQLRGRHIQRRIGGRVKEAQVLHKRVGWGARSVGARLGRSMEEELLVESAFEELELRAEQAHQCCSEHCSFTNAGSWLHSLCQRCHRLQTSPAALPAPARPAPARPAYPTPALLTCMSTSTE